MNTHDSQTDVVFSFAQATSMLPLLRLIVADISLSHRDLTERRMQLHRIARRREKRSTDNRVDSFYREEIDVTRADLKEEEQQLDALIHELESLGVILQSAHDGIVVFPAVIEDKSAYYCWKMGDIAIAKWHWPGETYADSRPL